MVRRITKFVLSLILGISFVLDAQTITFVKASVNAKKVKVKQPFELRISVYTQTWFTTAPNLDNIVIPGSITIKKDRAQGSYETINNVRYTLLNFDFIVFPIKEGELLIPEISLKYSTPDKGDFKGKDVERKTEALRVMVDSLGNDFSLSNWLVAGNFNVSESWNKDMGALKVGDVVERKISIKAAGTLAALLPSSDSLSISWGRVYHRTPILENRMVNGILKSERTETVTILLEKPGKFVIPEQNYFWWNPEKRKNYSKSLSERKIIIEDNPDLAILKSIQDSLDAIKIAEQKETAEEKPVTLLGLSVWQFVVLLVVILLFIFQIKKFGIFVIKKLKDRKAAYLKSEKFCFKQFKEACEQNDLKIIRARLFNWINKISGDNNIHSINHFILKNGNAEIMILFDSLEKKLFGKDSSKISFPSDRFFKELNNARNKYFIKKEVSDDEYHSGFQLNP